MENEKQFSHYASLFEKALREAPHKVVMFVDMVDSTDLKVRSAEVEWLPTVGRFLDLVSDAVRKSDGTLVKYLGDGVLAVFDDEQAASAINAAIKVQEDLESDNESNRLRNCQCRIGVATGKVVEYEGPGGAPDYIGTVVDLAARLSGAASPGAIWADIATIDSANLSKISSKVGVALKRSSREYVSDEARVGLKGFTKTIVYKEIIWSQTTKGASNEVTTMMADRVAAQHVKEESPHRDGYLTGHVASWKGDLGWGFIRTSDRGDHYVDRRHLVDGATDLTVGRMVTFIPRPNPLPDKRPTAGCVVQEGQKVAGSFVTKRAAFGFIGLRDNSGNELNLFIHLGGQADSYSLGQTVTAIAQPNARGTLQGVLTGEPATGVETVE